MMRRNVVSNEAIMFTNSQVFACSNVSDASDDEQ
jgi:hypothetical protein